MARPTRPRGRAIGRRLTALTGAVSLLAPALGSARAFAEGPVDGPPVDGPGAGGPDPGAPVEDAPGDDAPATDEGGTEDTDAEALAAATPMVDGMACEADVAIAKVYARDGLRPQFGMLALEKYARFIDGIGHKKGKYDGDDKPHLEEWDARLSGATDGVEPTITDIGIGEDDELLAWWYPFLVVDTMPATLLDEADAVPGALDVDLRELAGSSEPGIAADLVEPKPIDEIDEFVGTEAEFLDQVLHPWAVSTLGLDPDDMSGYAAMLIEDVRSDTDPAVGLEGVRLTVPVVSQDLSESPYEDHFDLIYGDEGLVAELGEKKSDPAAIDPDGLGALVGPSHETDETLPFPGRRRGTIVVDLEVIDPAVELGDPEDPDSDAGSVCILAGVARFRSAGGGAATDDDAPAGPVPTSVPSGEGPSAPFPALAFAVGLTAAGAVKVRRRLAGRPQPAAPVG